MKADGSGPTLKLMGHAGTAMQRRLSSTVSSMVYSGDTCESFAVVCELTSAVLGYFAQSSALNPVPEEEERDTLDDEDGDETFHTCDEDEVSLQRSTYYSPP